MSDWIPCHTEIAPPTTNMPIAASSAQ